MARRPAAVTDGPHQMAMVRPTRSQQTGSRPKIMATVTVETGPLSKIDFIRLDASRGSLRQICQLRSRYDRPSFLDLPGPGDHDRTSPLTTSEFLIFASAESFEWVGLRGVTEVDEVMRARDLLEPSTRIASTVSQAETLDDHGLRRIAAASDALIFPYGEIAARFGSEVAQHHVERSLSIASSVGRPLLLSGGLLNTMIDSVMPEISQLESLAEFALDGCAGFVLVEETAACSHARLCVDTLNMVLAPWEASPLRRQGTARVAGTPMLSPQLHSISQD